MYCNNCGKKLSEDENFCPKCGKEKNNNAAQKSNNNDINKKSDFLSIIALIIGIVSLVLSIFTNSLSIILAIVGIILGAISKTKVKIKVASIILNVFAILVFAVVTVFSFISDSNFLEKTYEEEEVLETNPVVGKYNCASFDGSNKKGDYIVRFELNSDNTFLWGKYGDTKNNYVKGTFTYKDLKKKNNSGNYSYYDVDIDGDEFVESGRKQTQKYHSTYEFGITKENGKKQGIIMNTKTYNMYYCYEE